MTELDDDRLELLERQLAERVTERVRPALFRTYASVGVAVIGALGFVSWDLVDDIKSEIKSEIAASVETKREEINEQAAEVAFIAKRVNEVIQRVEEQLEEFQPQADDLDETVDKLNELSAKSRLLQADFSRQLQPLATSVEDLSNQLQILAEQVNELNAVGTPAADTAEATEPQQSVQERSATIQSVISGTKQAEERLVQAREKTTVFFQFAGGSRRQAETVSSALSVEGYVIPDEDEESNALRKHEVRFFYQEDEAAAQRLADATNKVLRNLAHPDGETPVVEVRSLVAYTGRKNRPGVLELWLDVASVSATPATRWSQTPPRQAWCYQENRLTAGPQQYSVHCHWSQARCEAARGPNPKYEQSRCEAIDLSAADWDPSPGGWQGAWYEFRPTPFSEPFPRPQSTSPTN